MPSPAPVSDRHQTQLRDFLTAEAHAQGFDSVGIMATSDFSGKWGQRLRNAIDRRHHGTMAWLAETSDRRRHPQALWSAARSAVVVTMNYGPAEDPRQALEDGRFAAISVYAQNRDYHQLIKGRLKTLAGRFVGRARQLAVTADVKVFVDTAPVLEKPLAMHAGIGWLGKHTNLVSTEFGSWLFLGVLLTDVDLPTTDPSSDHCGSCRACLDCCPTNAFPAPYQLDARRCISYLTIEHDGPIDPALRPLMGNRIYGCDDCLAACPWNKFSRIAAETKLQARDDLKHPPLAELATLSDSQFRAKFAGSPIKRIGRNKFIRNVLIAIGNSGDKALLKAAAALLADPYPAVRGAAVWAVRQLSGDEEFAALQAQHGKAETDPSVNSEWEGRS